MITQKERIMGHQLTFADSEFSNKRRKTRKEIFLSRMDALLPWPQLLEVVDHSILRQEMDDTLIH
jgi:hypothetical protein